MNFALDKRGNPLEVLERWVAQSQSDWSFERVSQDELTLVVTGKRAEYQLSCTWMQEIEALHLACAFDLKVPDYRRAEVQALIAMINARLWIGHFDLWPTEGMVMYRHALLLPSDVEVSAEQCKMSLNTALHTCETYFAAFQFVVWAGKTADEAIKAAMFDTKGQA